jgi:hypothetical protein
VSDIIPSAAAHAQEWRRRYQAAIIELNPAKSLQRIAEARSTIVDKIEDSFSKPSDPEQVALCNALERLTRLRRLRSAKLANRERGLKERRAQVQPTTLGNPAFDCSCRQPVHGECYE